MRLALAAVLKVDGLHWGNYMLSGGMIATGVAVGVLLRGQSLVLLIRFFFVSVNRKINAHFEQGLAV